MNTVLSVLDIKKLLLNDYPLLLVDRVSSLTPFESIKAHKCLTYTEPVFQGHFKNTPIYPASYIIEGTAQSCGILLAKSITVENKQGLLLTVDKAVFTDTSTCGDTIEYNIELLKAPLPERRSKHTFFFQFI